MAGSTSSDVVFVVKVNHSRTSEPIRIRMRRDRLVGDMIVELSKRLSSKRLAVAALHWEHNANIELDELLALGNVGRQELVAEVDELADPITPTPKAMSWGGVTKPRGPVVAKPKKNTEPNGRRRSFDEDSSRRYVVAAPAVSPGLLSRPWFVFLAGAVAATAAGRLRQQPALEEEPAAKLRKATESNNRVFGGSTAPLQAKSSGLMAELTCLRERMAAAKEGREDDIEHCEPYVVSLDEHHHVSAQIHHSSLALEEEVIDPSSRPFSPLRIATLCVLILSLVFCGWFVQNVDQLPEAMEAYLVGSSKGSPSLRKLIAYRVDCWFSSNPYSKSLALLYLSIALVVYGGGFLYGVSGTGLGDAFWETLSGVGIDWTFAGYSSEHSFDSASGFLTRLVAICTSLGGMFITALLLGIVSDSIAERVDDLKKGKSEVLESGHTLIIGWSEKLLDIIREISLANESEGGGVIVLLSEKNKTEQDFDVQNFDYAALGTTVICRQGNPMICGDLKKVSASAARAIIVLAEEGCPPDQSDARSMRLVLSLIGLRENGGGLAGHIVVEVQDIDNEHVIQMVGGDSVETIVAHDVIGRLMIQCARQPGLAQVWGDLLGFEGAEFYIKEWPELTGLTFGECLYRFNDAVPLGVLQIPPHQKNKNGLLLLESNAPRETMMINPPDSLVLREGDALCVLAEDDDSYEPSAAPGRVVELDVLSTLTEIPAEPECVLFCGWRRDMDDIIQILDEFVCKGSELHLFNEVPASEQRERLVQERLQRKRPRELRHLSVFHHNGRLCSRRDLELLPMAKFTSAIILANESDNNTADATNRDSQALATLLLLRDLQAREARSLAAKKTTTKPSKHLVHHHHRNSLSDESTSGEDTGGGKKRRHSNASWAREMRQKCSCVVLSEILDSRTQTLIHEAGISDYVLSNKLVSMTLSMVAEDRQVNDLVKTLFEAEGSEFYLKPASNYIGPQSRALSFYDVMRHARNKEKADIVIGYKRAQDAAPTLNPANKTTRRLWDPTDLLVVLSED